MIFSLSLVISCHVYRYHCTNCLNCRYLLWVPSKVLGFSSQLYLHPSPLRPWAIFLKCLIIFSSSLSKLFSSSFIFCSLSNVVFLCDSCKSRMIWSCTLSSSSVICAQSCASGLAPTLVSSCHPHLSNLIGFMYWNRSMLCSLLSGEIWIWYPSQLMDTLRSSKSLARYVADKLRHRSGGLYK
jgi:hypothetical protein